MNKDMIRHFIIGNALIQASLGGHYLNGSDGGHPGAGNGYKGRNVKLIENGAFDEVAVRTAYWNGKRCKGRYEKVGGIIFKPNSNPLERVKKYCEENSDSGLSPEFWDAFENGLYPRRLESNKNSSMYLGEDCTNKRHFDCISFVNWVLTTTLQKSFKYSIVQYEGKKEGGGIVAPVKTWKDSFPELQNADILTRIKWKESDDTKIDSKHIGFYMVGGKVIEASGSSVGVIISDYSKKEWTGMCRIKDNYLKIGA